ncbi:intermediate conductance calcium-activated potassium channel protein 4 isoform X2 [Protopterus annectens]|uniref:intermediate conductance calcium-activated potassium channel protein 4 isoform X2 n=1 Tax=Protopterus annectens TaxID=7888 RepID=UPI001CFB7B1D|nr:intermediate conductance calcium-activated potassium channel protein 4 isoform X2 [Protopterus annectens]
MLSCNSGDGQLEMLTKVESTKIHISNSHYKRSSQTFRNLGKLRERKILTEKKKLLCAWSLVVALFGILVMVLQTELFPPSICRENYSLSLLPTSTTKGEAHSEVLFHIRQSYATLIAKSIISVSTAVLLLLIITFHAREVQLFMIDNSLEEWRIAMTTKKFFSIVLELVVCSLHPFPTGLHDCIQANENLKNINNPPFSSLDIFLCTSMFLRLYLIHRTVMLHSRVLVDASYRSIGSLNKINFQFRFVLKILMNTYPGIVLLIVIVCMWVIASWILSLCERQYPDAAGNIMGALWLIPITFLTTGYGDLVPYTLCGKAVCLITGVMGVSCTALLVAVVAKKLELNKAEKHVHNFMMDMQYTKQIRNAAANVLRESWLLYKHNRLMMKRDTAKIRKHQRNLLTAIQLFQEVRLKQRKLQDQVNAMVDISKMQMIMCDLSSHLNSSYKDLEMKIESLDKKLDNLTKLITTTVEQRQL